VDTPSPATESRRKRQLRDIAAAIAAADDVRASGLACEHLYEFPEDHNQVEALLEPP
jgi:hypothetical protein